MEKKPSMSTLAERRRIPTSPEKLKVYTQIKHSTSFTSLTMDDTTEHMTEGDQQRLERLKAENAQLPPQVKDPLPNILIHKIRERLLISP